MCKIFYIVEPGILVKDEVISFTQEGKNYTVLDVEKKRKHLHLILSVKGKRKKIDKVVNGSMIFLKTERSKTQIPVSQTKVCVNNTG